MCNLSEGIYNSGFNDGTYGRAKTDLRNLIESTGWSLAKAMEMLRIPPEEKENLEKELQKKTLKAPLFDGTCITDIEKNITVTFTAFDPQ